ncbi:hypothetical protein FNV43_RR22689 [Rhamnella rubrinervis]|uniref:Uncharacterized protein n=1 Tax=Rhamnella rubrinervis TaxID=2594499 RepID=A0A8K0GSQ3_9ROSA|nr:hypothetical protein FNV43_RR22689 [Rhamnella rubrinervis]
MKSPCAILALLPLLLFASTIESRNEPGAYWRTPTNDQPINLKPSPSSPSHGPIIHRPIPSGPGYGLIRSGQSDDGEPQVIVKYSGQRSKASPITHNEGFKTPKSSPITHNEGFKTPKPSAKDVDATQTFTMIFGDAFKHINSPARDSRLTPDANNVAIIHFLENLKGVSASPVKPTPCIQTINVDVKTPNKSPYNNNISPAFAASYSVKATPDAATTSIDRETLMKLFHNKFRATPYASHYSGDDVVPNGKSPPAQPSPRNIINWI